MIYFLFLPYSCGRLKFLSSAGRRHIRLLFSEISIYPFGLFRLLSRRSGTKGRIVASGSSVIGSKDAHCLGRGVGTLIDVRVLTSPPAGRTELCPRTPPRLPQLTRPQQDGHQSLAPRNRVNLR